MKKRIVSFLLVFVMIFTIAQPAMAYAQVGMNSRGKDVQDLQVMLNTVDNAKLVPDGIFGAKTKTAVMTFQRNNGLSVDGICGPKTWEKLTAKYNAIITPPSQTGSNSATNASSYPMVQNGSSGTAVRDLQKMLNAVQGAGLDPDGIFGTKTKNAVIAFQRANGLAADGICGPKTWGALLAKYNPNPKPTASSISIGSGKYDPISLTQGEMYSIWGKIESALPLNSITVGIYYNDGSPTSYVKTDYPRTTSYEIHSVDGYILFRLLSAGKYYFRVSATDSNGTTKQVVNKSFTVTAPPTPSLSASSLNTVPGCKMHYNYAGDGLCTSCATVTLLRRKEYVDGKKITFNFGDVRYSVGARPDPYVSVEFKQANRWTDSYTVTTGKNTSYNTEQLAASILGSNVAARKKYLATLLDKHPEGVVVYSYYNMTNKWAHAILVTDYTKTSNGDYQFYAYDPATTNNGVSYRTALENTYLKTKCGSVDIIFSQLIKVWYVK